MNVVLCSREYPGITPSGGIGVYIEAMANELFAQGNRIQVITEQPPEDWPLPDGWSWIGPTQMRHPLGYIVRFISAQDGFRTNPHGYSFSLFEILNDLTSSERIDLIEFPDYQGEGYFAIKAKRLLGYFSLTTLLVHGHMSLELVDGLNGENARADREAIFRIERYAIQYADVATVPCDDLGALYATSMPRQYLRKSHPVPVLSRIRLTPKVISSEISVILYVGRLEHRKGVDRLIMAAQKLLAQGHKFQVRLIGGDTELRGKSYRAHLQSMIAPLYRSSFEFVGRVDREALAMEYRDAALVVLPSRFENWPNVALEAMAYGALVMGSIHGGMREMLKDGAGILIDPLEDGAMEEAMGWVLTHQENIESYRDKAQRRARYYAAQPSANYEMFVKVREEPEHGRDQSIAVVVAMTETTSDVEVTLDMLLGGGDFTTATIIVGVDSSINMAMKAKLRQGYGEKVVIVETSKRGLGAARNVGARASTADVIAFCDAGDGWSPVGLRGLAWAFTEKPVLAAMAPMLDLIGGSTFAFAPEDIFNPAAAQRNVMPGPIAVRKLVFDDLGGYDENLMEGFDAWDLALRLAIDDHVAEMLPIKGAYRYHMQPTVDGRQAALHRRRGQEHFLDKYPHLSPAVAMSSVLTHALVDSDLPSYNASEATRRDKLVRSVVGRVVLSLSPLVPASVKSPIRKIVVKLFHAIGR